MLTYALGILQKNEKILFLLRKNTPFFSDYYGLIGGKVEDDESITNALIREIYEEIGITITKDDTHFVHCLSFKNEQGKAILAVVFKINSWTSSIINKEPDKCADLAWFSSDNLPQNIIPRHHHIMEMVQQGILYSESSW
jgi:8-oxo-dGTP pyrophosphatase MutT (NUDIX family)